MILMKILESLTQGHSDFARRMRLASARLISTIHRKVTSSRLRSGYEVAQSQLRKEVWMVRGSAFMRSIESGASVCAVRHEIESLS
jgi:hypothetical protein